MTQQTTFDDEDRLPIDRPLSDVRIVAIEQYGAGPFGTLQLAELGADVIKVEDPSSGGDIGRYVPPDARDADSLFFQSFNHGKRSVALDLRNHAGREVFERLVERSDAVFSNLRGDVPEKLGLRYVDLAHINRRIVCCSLSAYGMTGPRAAEPGYDYLIQGLAGWMSLTGQPDGPPTKTGLSVVDLASGYAASAGLLAGILTARRTGRGMDCDLSLYDVAMNLLAYVATWYLTAGFEAQRTFKSAHPTLVPFQNFETSDGWIVVVCAKEVFWERLVEVLDEAQFRSARFATFAERLANGKELLDALDRRFLQRPTKDWIELLTSSGVPCAPVNTLGGAMAEPQASARDLFHSFPHRQHGDVTVIRSPLRLWERSYSTVAAPGLGENTWEIMRDVLEVGSEEVKRWEDAGAFGERTQGKMTTGS